MGKNQKDKTQLLEQIKADIISQNICPDLAQQATNLVMGNGNADSKIVFIGEAPGKNEDLQAKPFVGAAGKFLEELLGCIGLDRSQVYITNIVKYRPPNNRDPEPAEKRAFWPFLLQELDVIKPKIIATLGRHSMENFLPERKISQVHGQPMRIKVGNQKVIILPLYHPASALYNGSQRKVHIEDIMAIPKIINQINESKKD